MSGPILSVITGDGPRHPRPRTDPALQNIAKRWRHTAMVQPRAERSDVISLMDGWIRLLERSVARDEKVQPR
jgi:hypothetical protein